MSTKTLLLLFDPTRVDEKCIHETSALLGHAGFNVSAISVLARGDDYPLRILCVDDLAPQTVEEIKAIVLAADGAAAERERCAKIVEDAYREFDGYGKYPQCRSVLAAIIRSGE